MDSILPPFFGNGPLFVARRFYSEGIFNGNCEKQLNHGILAVGYGSSSQGDYW